MAKVICGISGIEYKCQHIPMILNKRETAHPIFFLKQRKLLELYQLYSENRLTEIDSYLLFTALLYSTDSINFSVPCRQTSQTQKIIAANIAQLVKVIHLSNAIQHPSFKLPGYYIRQETAGLDTIHNWLKSCLTNITTFKLGIAREKELDEIRSVENKLAAIIKSPENGDIKIAAAVAKWANLAADFPAANSEYWMSIIRKCYNITHMFSTPKADLVAIKEHCENNLEPGSLYFHTLMKILKTGIANHNDFLGLGNLGDTPSAKYTLLDTPPDNSREIEALENIAATAPTKEPVESDYPNKLAFIRAKLAYKQAQKMLTKENI